MEVHSIVPVGKNEREKFLIYMNGIGLRLIEKHIAGAQCVSKFWGFPVMPDSFDYPSYKDEDGEEGQYDFICQINCAELPAVAAGKSLPEKGMLYFFARIGYYAGNFWEEACPEGLWNKDDVKVIYTPRTDFDNFAEMVLTDEDGNEICYPEKAVEFVLPEGNGTNVSPDQVHRLLGSIRNHRGLDLGQYRVILKVGSCRISDDVELEFPENTSLYFIVPEADLSGEKKTFRNARAVLL